MNKLTKSHQNTLRLQFDGNCDVIEPYKAVGFIVKENKEIDFT